MPDVPSAIWNLTKAILYIMYIDIEGSKSNNPVLRAVLVRGRCAQHLHDTRATCLTYTSTQILRVTFA
jgi:hypothetical protein